MDGGSSSLPLSPQPAQVYLRRAAVPAPPPAVRFFRPPAPIPIFSSRGPGQRGVPKPPMPPPAAAQAPTRPQPAPNANQQLLPQPAGAMRPPRPPSAAAAMLPPPAPQGAAKARERAAPPFNNENNGREIPKAEVKEENVQGLDKPNITKPVKVIKRVKNSKANKQTMDASNGGKTEGDPGPLCSSNNCRYDSSLSLLTKKFVSLLQGAEDGTIDLNKASEMLEVQKRRIYDITNVLEGVDLIEKTFKNIIRWKGFDVSKPKEKEHQISALKEEFDSLYKEDERLEKEIRETQEKLDSLALDKDKRKFLYVLKDDINKIPRFKESTLIAINAPRGTSIEVPDPNEDLYLFGNLESPEMRYQMVLRSSMGPIDCYLMSDSKEIFNPGHQVTPDSSGPVVATGSSQVLQHMDCDRSQSVQQMDCDPIEAVQLMNCDPSQAIERPESNAACTNIAAPSRKHEAMADILRIVPSDTDADADYWFLSDPGTSLTDTWAPVMDGSSDLDP